MVTVNARAPNLVPRAYVTSVCSGRWPWHCPGCRRTWTLLLLCQVSIGLRGRAGVSVLLNRAVGAVVGFVHRSLLWGEEGMGMLLGVSAETSSAFAQGFCVGESSPECPREGLGEQPRTQYRLLHLICCTTGAPDASSHSKSQDAPRSRGWSRGPEGAANAAMSKGALVPEGALALAVPRVPLGSSLEAAAVPTRSVPALSVPYG